MSSLGFKFSSKPPQCYLSNFFGGAEFTYMSLRTKNPRLRDLYLYLRDVDWETNYELFKKGRKKLQPNSADTDHYRKINEKDEGFKVGAGVLAKLISSCFKSTMKNRLKAVNSIANKCLQDKDEWVGEKRPKITSEDFIDGDPLQKKEWMLQALTLKYQDPFYRDILLKSPDGVYESNGRSGDALWTGEYKYLIPIGQPELQIPTNGLLGHCLSIIKERLLQSHTIHQPVIIGQYIEAAIEQQAQNHVPINHYPKADTYIYPMDKMRKGIEELKKGAKDAIIIDAEIVLPFDGDIMVKYWNSRVKPEFKVPVPLSADDLLQKIKLETEPKKKKKKKKKNITKYTKLPGMSQGMWHTYATEAHDSALASPVVQEIFEGITGTKDWEVRPNRIRVNPVNKQDGYKSAHLEGEHVMKTTSRIVCIVCVTAGRTFTYYEGSNNCEKAQAIYTPAPISNFMNITTEMMEANNWKRTTITTTKPGQIILFANSVIHEISRENESLSLFLSPYDPSPEIVGNSVCFYDGIKFEEENHPYHEKIQSSITKKETLLKKARKKAKKLKDATPGAPPFPIRLATSGERRNWPSQFSGLTRKQCDIFGSLFNGPGAYWPSGKATFPMFHSMATGAFQYKLLPFMFVAVEELQKKNKKDKKSEKHVVQSIKFNWEVLTEELVNTPISENMQAIQLAWARKALKNPSYTQEEHNHEMRFNPAYFQSLPFWKITESEIEMMRTKYTGIPDIAWKLIEFWTKDIRKCSDNVAERRGYISKQKAGKEEEEEEEDVDYVYFTVALSEAHSELTSSVTADLKYFLTEIAKHLITQENGQKFTVMETLTGLPIRIANTKRMGQKLMKDFSEWMKSNQNNTDVITYEKISNGYGKLALNGDWYIGLTDYGFQLEKRLQDAEDEEQEEEEGIIRFTFDDVYDDNGEAEHQVIKSLKKFLDRKNIVYNDLETYPIIIQIEDTKQRGQKLMKDFSEWMKDEEEDEDVIGYVNLKDNSSAPNGYWSISLTNHGFDYLDKVNKAREKRKGEDREQEELTKRQRRENHPNQRGWSDPWEDGTERY